MRAKTIVLVFVVGAALAVLGFGLKERSARQDAERAADANRQQRARLDGELRQAERRLSEVETERRRIEVALGAARKKATAVPAEPARPVSAAVSPISAERRALINDPQFQKLQLAAERVRLMGTYLPLCEQLNLTGAQRERFFAILHKREEQKMDLDTIRAAQGAPADDPVFVKLKQQMDDECRTAQTALLGETGCRQFETYERSVPSREFVNLFVRTAAVAGAGITAGQADALTRAMVEANAIYQQGGVASGKTCDWDKVLATATTTLSVEQFAVFKNSVINIRNQVRLGELAKQH